MAQEARKEEKLPVRGNQSTSASPVREIMENTMDDYFSGWPRMRIGPFEWRIQEFSPTIDVIDEEDRIRIEAEMPGMNIDDIEVTATSDSVIIKGDKKSQSREEQAVCYSERCYGSFKRVVALGQDVETDGIKARFKNGVLEIIVPKPQESRLQTRKIEIKSEGVQQSGQENIACEIAEAGGTKDIKRVY